MDKDPRGFGLLQRKRRLEDYEDPESRFDLRPSLWVEPRGSWGEGHVVLVEIPSDREIHDNIVAYWQPNRAFEPGQEVVLSYRLRAASAIGAMHPGGKAINTFQTPPRASGSNAPSDPRHRRFIIDFAGGTWREDMSRVE